MKHRNRLDIGGENAIDDFGTMNFVRFFRKIFYCDISRMTVLLSNCEYETWKFT